MLWKQFLPIASMVALGLSGAGAYFAFARASGVKKLLGLLPILLWGITMFVFPVLYGFFSYRVRAAGGLAESVTWPWWGAATTLVLDVVVSVGLIVRFRQSPGT